MTIHQRKQRFHFAASAFARMCGPDRITEEIKQFCIEWADSDEVAPLQGLNEVDRYFKQLWDTSHTGS